MNSLTNLDELSFLTVLALPNASKIGFACNNCCSNPPYKWEICLNKFVILLNKELLWNKQQRHAVKKLCNYEWMKNITKWIKIFNENS